MTLTGILTISLFLLLTYLLTKPLGLYLARVYGGERTLLDPVLRPVERGIYAVSGVDPTQEQGWRGYTAAMLLFNVAGLLLRAIARSVRHGRR